MNYLNIEPGLFIPINSLTLHLFNFLVSEPFNSSTLQPFNKHEVFK